MWEGTHAASRTRGGILHQQLLKAETLSQFLRQQSGSHTAERLPMPVRVCCTVALQADHNMLLTIDFLLCVPIFTWKCNKTVIIPIVTIFLHGKNSPTPSPPTLTPPRQLLLRLPSGERLTTAYQPLAHHTAGTVAQRKRGRRRVGKETETNKRKMAKEM